MGQLLAALHLVARDRSGSKKPIGCEIHSVAGMNATKTAGIKTVLFPVEDLAKAKALFGTLMGEPQQDAPYYVGYSIDGQDIGLVPNGHQPGQHGKGMTGPVCFWHVNDIRASLQALLDAGAKANDDVRDVGGGRLVASVKDPDGNPIGLIQNP